MKSAILSNPFVSDNFAPICHEKDPVVGQIPPDLCGMLVRDVFNPQFHPIGYYHWFDGDGLLHGVYMDGLIK